jgi:dTDP-4-amino-4,6-dideoxygalactose transaminase
MSLAVDEDVCGQATSNRMESLALSTLKFMFPPAVNSVNHQKSELPKNAGLALHGKMEPEAIPFHRPYMTGKEVALVQEACSGLLASDGIMATRCTELLAWKLGLPHVLLAPSCTAALELCMRAIGLKQGDEVIVPSFTFSSTANAILLTGATPVFVDIRPDTLTLDEAAIEMAITPQTRAICVVHYAGVSSDLDVIERIANQHDLVLIEDAAQAVNAFYKHRPLGGIGALSAYSFHHTKNYSCGEGGAICVNDPDYLDFAHIYRNKGTNRHSFMLGHIDKYTWVGLGSSQSMSEPAAAFLVAQLEVMDEITALRDASYKVYLDLLRPLEAKGWIELPKIPDYAQSNYHLFHILLRDGSTRNDLLAYLNRERIGAAIHFVPLHSAPMGVAHCRTPTPLPETEKAGACLLRLPFFTGITMPQQVRTAEAIYQFFAGEN